MKFVALFCILILFNCSSQKLRHHTLEGRPMAYASTARGNINASASTWDDQGAFCFDIVLSLKGGKEYHISSSNWTLAWLDTKGQYHLIHIIQRNPGASKQDGKIFAPYVTSQEWTNSFRNCIPNTSLDEVQSLILTPKDSPYANTESLNLKWHR